MVSFQELYEFATALIDIASGDVEAAKVLSENRLLDKALYFIEQGSEKITKASYLSQCLCFHSFSDEAVSRCYQNIVGDEEGNVYNPDNFVRRIGHDPLNLFKRMLSVNSRDFFQPPSNVLTLEVLDLYRNYINKPPLLESCREVYDPISKQTNLYIAKYIESALRKECSSNNLESSMLCKSDMKRLEEKIEECEEAENNNACLNLAESISDILRSLSQYLFVKDLWRQLNIEKLLEITYDDELQKLRCFSNKLVEELTKRVEPVTSLEKVQVVKQKIKFTVECLITVNRSVPFAFTPFYLTSPLYNYIRYPNSPEKHNMCKDE
ncbi:MAG: hypothetical protein QXY53_05860, partial [Desulfurococcaceae archaeon]